MSKALLRFIVISFTVRDKKRCQELIPESGETLRTVEAKTIKILPREILLQVFCVNQFQGKAIFECSEELKLEFISFLFSWRCVRAERVRV